MGQRNTIPAQQSQRSRFVIVDDDTRINIHPRKCSKTNLISPARHTPPRPRSPIKISEGPGSPVKLKSST